MADEDADDTNWSPEELNSLNYALEETRRRYDDEENRRASIDNKISGLLGLNAILVSIFTSTNIIKSDGFSSVTLALLIFSTILSFTGLIFGHIYWGKYSRPLSHPGHIYAKAQKTEAKFCTDYLRLYTSCSKKNEGINNKKKYFLYFNFIITGVAISFVVYLNV